MQTKTTCRLFRLSLQRQHQYRDRGIAGRPRDSHHLCWRDIYSLRRGTSYTALMVCPLSILDYAYCFVQSWRNENRSLSLLMLSFCCLMLCARPPPLFCWTQKTSGKRLVASIDRSRLPSCYWRYRGTSRRNVFPLPVLLDAVLTETT